MRAGVIRAKFSPDGTYVLAGSEDGKVYAWDTVSASPVSFLDGKFGYSAPLCDLSFHPKQHLVALTCFGGDHPVLVYCTNRPDTPKLLDGQAGCDAVLQRISLARSKPAARLVLSTNNWK